MFILISLILFLWIFASLITLWGTWHTLKKQKRQISQIQNTKNSVSILKPVKGEESGMWDNFESFFKLSYPEFEIIFCVNDKNDPAIALIQNLINKYKKVDAKLLITDDCIGLNPKVNNLVRAYGMAKYERILISDSNVRVSDDYLIELNNALNEQTGMVTAVVAGTYAECLGGHLEATYLNTFYCRWMWICSAFGFPTVVGKSMFFRRSTLERLGGIKTFSCYIAEDYMAGQGIQRLGLKVRILNQPIRQTIGDYSFKSFWHRHLRWGRIRKVQAPLAFLFEPLFTCFFSGLIGAVSFFYLYSFPVHLFFLLHCSFWMAQDLLLISKVNSLQVKQPVVWVVRELLAIPLWIHTLAGNAVNWRGRVLKLKLGGLLTEA